MSCLHREGKHLRIDPEKRSNNGKGTLKTRVDIYIGCLQNREKDSPPVILCGTEQSRTYMRMCRLQK